MQFIVVILIVLVAFQNVHSMSEKQVKAAGKLVRNACQPKTKVTDAQIEDMHKGKWDDDAIIKCYMNCVLSMLKVAKKNGEFQLEEALKQIPTLPEPLQAPTESTMRACSAKVTANDDKCDSSWRFAKCMYEDNPGNYFLP